MQGSGDQNTRLRCEGEEELGRFSLLLQALKQEDTLEGGSLKY